MPKNNQFKTWPCHKPLNIRAEQSRPIWLQLFKCIFGFLWPLGVKVLLYSFLYWVNVNTCCDQKVKSKAVLLGPIWLLLFPRDASLSKFVLHGCVGNDQINQFYDQRGKSIAFVLSTIHVSFWLVGVCVCLSLSMDACFGFFFGYHTLSVIPTCYCTRVLKHPWWLEPLKNGPGIPKTCTSPRVQLIELTTICIYKSRHMHQV
jgi:hypothetical protein